MWQWCDLYAASLNTCVYTMQRFQRTLAIWGCASGIARGQKVVAACLPVGWWLPRVIFLALFCQSLPPLKVDWKSTPLGCAQWNMCTDVTTTSRWKWSSCTCSVHTCMNEEHGHSISHPFMLTEDLFVLKHWKKSRQKFIIIILLRYAAYIGGSVYILQWHIWFKILLCLSITFNFEHGLWWRPNSCIQSFVEFRLGTLDLDSDSSTLGHKDFFFANRLIAQTWTHIDLAWTPGLR